MYILLYLVVLIHVSVFVLHVLVPILFLSLFVPPDPLRVMVTFPQIPLPHRLNSVTARISFSVRIPPVPLEGVTGCHYHPLTISTTPLDLRELLLMFH